MNTEIYVFLKKNELSLNNHLPSPNQLTEKYSNFCSSFMRYSLNLLKKINIPTYPNKVYKQQVMWGHTKIFYIFERWHGECSPRNITRCSTPLSFLLKLHLYYRESWKLVLLFQYELTSIFVEFVKTIFKKITAFKLLDSGFTKTNGWHISYFDKIFYFVDKISTKLIMVKPKNYHIRNWISLRTSSSHFFKM